MLFRGTGFMQLMECLFKRRDQEELRQFSGMARRIWLRRNGGVGHLIEDIQFEIQAFQQWKLTFIKREGNITP